MRGLSLVAMSEGYSLVVCRLLTMVTSLVAELGPQRLQHVSSAVVAHGLGGSAARRIFPDQGSNPCPLHWQSDS